MNFTLSDLANNLSGKFNSIEYKKSWKENAVLSS